MNDNCNKPKVGIYLRISQEDQGNGMSESLENQQELITRYASEQGWSVADVFADDGWSGLNLVRVT